MTSRRLVTCVLVLLALAGSSSAAPYHAPRTSYGAPDLDGDWTNLTLTDFERRPIYKGLVVTHAEAAAAVKTFHNHIDGVKPKPTGKLVLNFDDVGQVTSEFPDRDVDLLKIYGQHRSSILVEPSDGRMAYTDAGKALVKAAEDRDDHDFSGPEARMSDERCIDGVSSAAGPPMIGEPQNANYKIVQTKGEIAILSEMIHDVRIVHMGAKHPAIRTHPHMGDSIGWWDGEALVIETVDQNVMAAPRFVGPHMLYVSNDAKVTERLTRVSAGEILYDFTVEDPKVYIHTLHGQMMLRATKAQQYEYACHEGNYSLPNILAGARAQEAAAREAKAAAKP